MGGSFARSIFAQPLPSATYNASNQQLGFGSQTLTYDLNGNLTSDGTNTYGWDARDRLMSISGPGVSASFQYDAGGRRSSKTVNGTTTNFLYDGADIVQEQSAQTGNANLLNGGIDEIFTRSDSAGAFSPLADGLGSSLSLTDDSGSLQTEYAYGAFGQSATSGASSNNSSQYTGRENDGTGLYYYRARFYSPELQRFLNEDPLGFASGDLNFYTYVGNSPISFVDPSGLTEVTFYVNSGTLIVTTNEGYHYYISATSGRGDATNNPRRFAEKFEGPIPPGQYRIDVRDLTDPGYIGDLLRNIRGDWGDWRVPIKAEPWNNAYGRDGFFLHGGNFPGSAGCIDMGGGIHGDSTTDFVKDELLRDPDGIIEVNIFPARLLAGRKN